MNFPSNPSENDTYAFGGKQWFYNGYGWVLLAQLVGEKGNKGSKGNEVDLLNIGLFSKKITPFSSGSTGTINHDLLLSGVFSHNLPASNFTANFTNVDATNNRTKICSIIVFQGADAYVPNAVEIGGVPQTIKWMSGITPPGTSLGVDIFTFTLIRINNAWTVTGNLIGFK